MRSVFSRRMLFMLGAALVIIAALATVKLRQIQAGMAQAASFAPPPEAVTTLKAEAEPWASTLSAIGTVTAVRGVTISADLPGVVESITFESGRTVQAGDVLLTQDTRQERAQLASAEAQRELARLNLARARGLADQGVLATAELDRAAAEHAQAVARVAEIEAAIQRKTIRAPFAGLLGIRQADKGQYLAGGDPIVELQALDPLYVDFSMPQQEVPRLRAGTEVRLSLEGAEVPARGRITAIDASVDPATRNVKVQATLANPDRALRPGMFVTAEVMLGQREPVVTLPASAINYAPYGDSVFVVEEMKGPTGEGYRGARQVFVKVGGARGDQVAVLTGVEEGQEVVTSGVFKLRNGAAVQVRNDLQPANDPAPRPEDN